MPAAVHTCWIMVLDTGLFYQSELLKLEFLLLEDS